MWKTITTSIISSLKNKNLLLPITDTLYQQARTTYILKRKTAPNLHKAKGGRKLLRSRHYVYELIKDTSVDRQNNIEVILTSQVEGLGNVGDKISVKQQFAYNNLLLPGLGVYVTPESEEKFKTIVQDGKKFSTPSAACSVKTLSTITLSVIMNKEMPWTLKPWHVKASFRKCGYVVPEDAIKLPEQPITGPNLDLEDKEFVITVTINKHEKVNVRCRIHHWSTDLADRLPYVSKFWELPTDPILVEQKPILDKIPKKVPKEVQNK